jgi:hypothetical protein
MSEQEFDILSDEEKRLIESVAKDNKPILLPIAINDLTVLIYLLDDIIKEHEHDGDFQTGNLIELVTYLIHVLELYHPKFVSELFGDKPDR